MLYHIQRIEFQSTHTHIMYNNNRLGSFKRKMSKREGLLSRGGAGKHPHRHCIRDQESLAG